AEIFGEPQGDTGDEEDRAGSDHGPEPHLLAGIEFLDVIGFGIIGVRDVGADALQPQTVGRLPAHVIEPSTELEEHEDYKPKSEPRMKEPGSSAASEQRGEPGVEPRREQRKAGK